MRDLAVLIPTRGRPDNIRKVIGAWDFTNAWDHADMVLVIDKDDPAYGGYLDLIEEVRHPDTGEDLIKTYEVPTWRPMVQKLNEVAAAINPGWFALGFAGDDHVPQTIWWARTYLEELRKLGTGMVYGDDGYQGRKLATEWAVTSDAVRALGRMVPAPVEHLYCDNAMMDLYRAAGAMLHLPQIRIEHRNPYAGKTAPMDDQYKRVNSREQYAKDRASYERWKMTTLPTQVGIVKALRPRWPWPTRTAPKEKPVKMTRPPFPSTFKQVKGVTPVGVEIALADFAAAVPADQEIVELGTYHGKTALVMAWGARQGHGAHVTAIDPWDLPGNVYGDEMGDLGSARKWAGYWVRSLGYSNDVRLIRAFSHEAAESWSVPEIDTVKRVGLLFVDGDHTAEGARRDIEAWAPHLAPGATIAIDDYVNPNYPGVAEAIDALVQEGVLTHVQVFHDRLGVTRLSVREEWAITGPAAEPIGAITSEGVSFSPGGQLVTGDLDREALEAEWRGVDPEGVAALEASAAAMDSDTDVSTRVQPGELGDVEAGTPIADLTIPHLKELARYRGIVLGARKDKRSEIIQALKDGR